MEGVFRGDQKEARAEAGWETQLTSWSDEERVQARGREFMSLLGSSSAAGAPSGGPLGRLVAPPPLSQTR